MENEKFIHEGVTYRVVLDCVEYDEVRIGQWMRETWGPMKPMDDVIGLVVLARHGWTGRRRWTDITLAVNGDREALRKTTIDADADSDAIFDIIEPLTGPYAAENRPSKHGGERPPMNIVVCFDGTGNENETQDTNVHRLFQLLDRSRSISNYYSGVGVGGRAIGNLLDQLTGRGAFRTLRAAYTFVRANFIAGDKIFIFGFSRGAFVARHLAGMIARIGLHHHTEIGYDSYRESLVRIGIPDYYGRKNNVQFLGLFACVPGNQALTIGRSARAVNNPILEPNILNVAHAVSRDERRLAFKPLIFKANGQHTLIQAWFPGYHSDVGGDQTKPLTNFALAWMIREAHKHGLWLSSEPNLQFDPRAPGKSSDWPLQKIGVRCVRKHLPDAEWILPEPDLSDLRK
jgi:hypothetical protein